MSKKEKRIEYHNTCPKCKSEMKRVMDKDRKHLLYYCKRCKQKYRIDIIHPMQEVECPHCNKVMKISAEQLSQLHRNTIFNFYPKKVKI